MYDNGFDMINFVSGLFFIMFGVVSCALSFHTTVFAADRGEKLVSKVEKCPQKFKLKNLPVKMVALSGYVWDMAEIEKSFSIMQNFAYPSYHSKDVFAPAPYIFCANTDEYRAHDFLDAVSDDKYKIIWNARGGYGAARTIYKLHSKDAAEKLKKSKIMIGFSDATAINIFLFQNFGWDKVIHGMNYNQISQTVNGSRNASAPGSFNPENFSILDKVLKGSMKNIVISDLKPINSTAQKSKKIESKITGGNLSLLQSSIGTNWEIKTDKMILIIEDVSEPSYRIDRMLEQLRQSGKFHGVDAVVFGAFHGCEPDVKQALERISNILDQNKIPVFQTERIGHGYHNYPFIYGAHTKIISENKNGKFTMTQKVPF